MFRKFSFGGPKSPPQLSEPPNSPASQHSLGSPRSLKQRVMESQFTLNNNKSSAKDQAQFQEFQNRALAKLPHALTPTDKLNFLSAAAPFIAAAAMSDAKDAEWFNFDFAQYLLGTCFNIFPPLTDESKRAYPQDFSQVFWTENPLNTRLRVLLSTIDLAYRSYPEYQLYCSVKNQPILSGKREKVAVVAIDFGSTHSGFAFALLQPPQTIVFPQGHKQPTAALLDRKTMQLICFGSEAREFFMRTLAGDMLLNKFSQTGDTAFSKEKYLYFDGDIKMRLWENAQNAGKGGKREDQLDAKTCRTLGGSESANLLTVVSKILERIKEDALDAVSGALNTLQSQQLAALASASIAANGNGKDDDGQSVVTSGSSSPKQSISSPGLKTSRRVQADDVLWVLTVPAIWREQDKQFMRQACQNAGVISETHSSDLTMALEPECAALALRSDELDLSPGSKMLVFDCGGGTCDVCALEVIDHPHGRFQCKLILVPTGGDWGGRQVDQAFFKFIQDLFGTAILDRCAVVSPAALIELQDQWERLKTDLRLEDFLDDGKIRKSIDVMYLLRESTGKSLSQLCKQFNALQPDKQLHVSCKSETLLGEATLLKLPIGLIRSFFDPVVDPIVSHAFYLFRTFPEGMKNLNQLLLVGGFGSSPYLKHKFQKAFPKMRIINSFRDKQTIFAPIVERSRNASVVGRNRNVSTASRGSNLQASSVIQNETSAAASVLVAMGAVKFGLQPSVVRSRLARMTLGVKATVEYNSKAHQGRMYRENKYYDREMKRHYIRNVFKPFLVVGEEVDSEKVVVNTFAPPNPQADRVKFDVYTCDDRPPVDFVTEEGCRLLARIYCPVVPGEMPVLEVRLTVGFTEISAEVAKNGEVVVKRVLFEFHPEDDLEGLELDKDEDSRYDYDPSSTDEF